VIPAGPHDLYRAGEAWFLIPTGRPLPAGPLVLVGVAGDERRVDPLAVAAFSVDAAAAHAFHDHAMRDAMERVGALIGAVAHLAASQESCAVAPRPGSLDEALGLDSADPAAQRDALVSGLLGLANLAATDRAALEHTIGQVRARWEGVDGGAQELLERLPAALAQAMNVEPKRG
jgi:hypothetical protein